MMTDTTQSTPYVGQSLRRREDVKFVTGNGRYIDDIKLPGMLYLAILRSPHAHALITGVDLSGARAAAGVRLALAGADLTGGIGNIKPNWVVPGTVVPDRPVMAVDRARFVGECVALSVAETREAAYDALERIEVTYEALPAVIDEEVALAMARRNSTKMLRTISRLISRLEEAITPRRLAGRIRSCVYASSTTGLFRPASRPELSSPSQTAMAN
jgi:CO/xanthine dehydrogenase Mo-binding subunit